MKSNIQLLYWIHIIPALALGQISTQGFSTQEHTIYHLRCARLSSGTDTALVGAAYDGTVLCYTPSGQRLWKNESCSDFPFDLTTADLTGDGRDETLMVAGDGTLYVLDHQGQTRWTFHRDPPLLQVCVLSRKNKSPIILTGGVEKKLYALSAQGELLHTVTSPYVVRHIRCGNIMGDGRSIAAVVTAKNDRSRFSLQLYEPEKLTPLWSKPKLLTTTNPTEGTKYYVPWAGNKVSPQSMLIYDINQDSKDEIILSNTFNEKGVFDVYNHEGQKILTSSKKGIKGKAYRMNLLSAVETSSPTQPHIMGLFGHQMVIYDLKGQIVKLLDAPYALTCSAFDQSSQTLYLGSSMSGGDSIYRFALNDPRWEEQYTQLQPIGKLARIEQNLKTLAEQIEHFQRPAYQAPPPITTVVTGKSADELQQMFLVQHDYQHVQFAQFNLLTENYDRDSLAGVWKTKRETRHRYNYKAEEIIAFAAEREQRHEPFVLWAGHGNDPFYMQLSTLAAVLKAAPTTLKALVFPEMERTDQDMAYAVRHHILPLADLCREHGVAKIILRNKNVFWNGSCYLDLWKDVLLNGDYKDIFIPSMEETNGRTQALSLSGRLGLWKVGLFDHLAGRAVTDNANFSRFWEWGAQQLQSHLIRSMSFRAALGADWFLVNIYQGNPADMTPFYRMIEKGVIAIPKRNELLSISNLCLGMKDPSPNFLKHGKNGHIMNLYEPQQSPMVFDRMDCYWGGAPTAPYDFARYAFGSQRRMLNFLPPHPYGMILTVPVEADLTSIPPLQNMLVTDGEFFYSKQGTSVTAPDYQATAQTQLEKAAEDLPLRVTGQVAWAVTRLDASYVRVTLIDAGYLDPDDRPATITLQHLSGLDCQDILTGESIAIHNQQIAVTVPAGILRILDIKHVP